MTDVAYTPVQPGDDVVDWNVNQLIDGLTGAVTTSHAFTSSHVTTPALTVRNTHPTGTAFKWRNDDDTLDALTMYQSATNGDTPVMQMDATTRVSIGADFSSGSWPHSLSVIKTAPSTGWIAVNVVQDMTGIDTDEAAGRFVLRQLAVGANGAGRALETQMVKSEGDVNHAAWAQEVGVHQDIAHGHGVNLYLTGDPQQWINPGATRFRMESAILMTSPSGWESPIKLYHTDGTTVLFRVVGGGISGDSAGDVMAAASIYSTGLSGASAGRVGLMDHTGAPSGQTWGGMHYDNTNSKLVIGAVKTGTGYRDVHIAANGGGVRLGVVGYNVVVGDQALATNATDGFLYIPGGAGAPTGVATAYTGRFPLYIDSTNHRMYFRDGSGWVALN